MLKYMFGRPTTKLGDGSSDTVRVNEASMIPGSLAVLELKNLSSDEEQQYFCEGVSEELINTLSRYKSLRVTSSNASFAFSDKVLPERNRGSVISKICSIG